MHRCLVITVLLLGAFAIGQQQSKPEAVLLPRLGDLRHPVSTKNAEAQQFFDQGMRLLYGFNHEEAERSFRRAAEIDPTLAMAWWGMAYAVGPNYNLPVDAAREKIAYDAEQKALALSASAPPQEKAYIEALAKRYTNVANPDYQKLSQEYADAMREVWRRYPDDPDAGTLFAESMMDLRPWELWNRDGTPAPGTEEIVMTLETVLRRNPDHMGAMHFYIHAVEASLHPERALVYADRLAAMNLTGAGHLVHMPAHIYFRSGNYDAARKANEDAAAADRSYIDRTGADGVYPLMYFSHNLHFLAIAAGMQGRCAEAVDAAQKLAANVEPVVAHMPDLAVFLNVPLEMDVRCGRWQERLNAPEPQLASPLLKAIWHYAHGTALARTGKALDAAGDERALAKIEAATARDQSLMGMQTKTWQVMDIAHSLLMATIDEAQGRKVDALRQFREAVSAQDQLGYDEPPDWYFPARESLGGALLRAGDAKQAEQVFRDDLARNPRNPRSLFDLAAALKRQGRSYDASWAEKQFQAAWQGADVQLSVDKL